MQLDLLEGQSLRDLGMEQALYSSTASEDWVLKARSTAELLAAKYGETDIEEVLKICPRPQDVSPNATGSVFKGKKFRLIGYKVAAKKTSHARRIGIWTINQ